jgi:hypothetical protein
MQRRIAFIIVVAGCSLFVAGAVMWRILTELPRSISEDRPPESSPRDMAANSRPDLEAASSRIGAHVAQSEDLPQYSRQGTAHPETHGEKSERADSYMSNSDAQSSDQSEEEFTYRIHGRTLVLKSGTKYRITSTKWNPNPRPYTPEESRRHAALYFRLRELVNDNAPDDEIRSVRQEMQAMGPGSALGATVRVYVWRPLPGQAEPPDSETVVIDLRNR